jgi:hypothetical protein
MIKYLRPYLGDVNLLDLQVIQHVGHGLKCHELPCTNMLLTLHIGKTPFSKDKIMDWELAYLNIIVNYFKEGAGTDSNAIYNLAESGICKGL